MGMFRDGRSVGIVSGKGRTNGSAGTGGPKAAPILCTRHSPSRQPDQPKQVFSSSASLTMAIFHLSLPVPSNTTILGNFPLLLPPLPLLSCPWIPSTAT